MANLLSSLPVALTIAVGSAVATAVQIGVAAPPLRLPDSLGNVPAWLMAAPNPWVTLTALVAAVAAWTAIARLLATRGSAGGILANVQRQAETCDRHIELGDAAIRSGNLADARRQFGAAIAVAGKRVAADPASITWAPRFAMSLDRLGWVEQADQNLPAARRHFIASFAVIAEVVAAHPAHPDSVKWLRSLSVSYKRLGETALEMGERQEARGHFEAALEIAEKASAVDPANVEWQRDLLMSHGMLGELAIKSGDMVEAMRRFETALAIAGKLAAADPADAGSQRDLAVSHFKLGQLVAERGQSTEAGQRFASALSILSRLVARAPGDQTLASALAEVRAAAARLGGSASR